MNAPQIPAPVAAEGAGIGEQFALPARRASALRQTLESVYDPFGIVAPIVHSQAAWGAHP